MAAETLVDVAENSTSTDWSEPFACVVFAGLAEDAGGRAACCTAGFGIGVFVGAKVVGAETGAGAGGGVFAAEFVVAAICGGGGGAADNVVFIGALRTGLLLRFFGAAATFVRFGRACCLRCFLLIVLRFDVLRYLGTALGLRGGETRSRDCGGRPPGIKSEPPPT